MPLARVVIRPGAAVLTSTDGAEIRTRLLIDCMGQRSPIVAQVREGAPPDGVCVVVGSCADGYAPEMNTFGDVIFADTPTQPASGGCPTQYFWEAFPASASPTQRTTYLFTYMDLSPERPSVLNIMDDYWKMLPGYQGVSLDQLEMKRVLFGLFTSYKDSPLPVRFDRVMQIGDAGGLQSPLSFGGFGAITRHIGRLTAAVEGALEADALGKGQLAMVNPYQANLRAAWLFQASMRPPVTPGAWSDDFISRVLVATFEVMEERGEAVMLPFLQDTLRVDGLALTIGGLMLSSPVVAVEILVRLGPVPLADCASTRASNSAALHPRARSCPASNAICLDDICPDRSTSRSDSRWRRVCPFCCDVPRIGTRLRAEPLARESGGAPAARAGTLRHRPVRRGLAVRQWSGLHATRAADADGPTGLGDGEARRRRRAGVRGHCAASNVRADGGIGAGRRASLNVSRRPWRASASYAPRRCVGPFLCVR